MTDYTAPTVPWCDDYLMPRVLCAHCGGDGTGVVEGLPDHAYHADRESLSSSGARALLATTPRAWLRAQRQGRKDQRHYDIGHVFHTQVLGTGQPVFPLDPKVHGLKADGKTVADKPAMTSAWKAAYAAARTRGEVPLHVDDVAVVNAMTDAVRAHPLAGKLFSEGRPELSLYARDDETGELIRARLDWLTRLPDGRPVIVDLKSTSELDDLAAGIRKWNYAFQECWYRVIYHALTGEWPAFLFVAVEKQLDDPDVRVVQVDPDDVAAEHAWMRRAIDIWHECRTTGRWPGHSPDIETISLPAWYRRTREDIQL